jgi:squalene-hopene/tetraprenyl-beta-curcumene cyclase
MYLKNTAGQGKRQPNFSFVLQCALDRVEREGMKERITWALDAARTRLLAHWKSEGNFEGRLSSSALSTAVASFALSLQGTEAEAARGRAWLMAHQNADGGWGDTTESPSNLATSLLAYAALQSEAEVARNRCETWLSKEAATTDAEGLTDAVLDFYGKDRTFSVPILTLCALAGVLGEDAKAWRRIPQLPFELAVFPRTLFRWLHLPVVSYALPALIAIGLVRHRRAPGCMRLPREACVARVLRVLEDIQPERGGFLEAAPLTGFVLMSLVGAGFGEHPVAQKCAQFLKTTQREDGSWPIDTHLTAWLTSLSVSVLGDSLPAEKAAATTQYLLESQHTTRHPFTQAAPGGWAWTHLPGGVPDGDDTSAALLALHHAGKGDLLYHSEAAAGLEWLLGLQNRDGGMPTFCRGWGRLPFDRSCADLTAHALRAMSAWRDAMTPNLQARLDHAIARSLTYLEKTQRSDGAWLPLWFGNQGAPNRENPVLGTARVLKALAVVEGSADMQKRGQTWLLAAQNDDGGWGGTRGLPSTIEETALAVSALASDGSNAAERGVQWLLTATQEGKHFPSDPIGLYFASLWYDEALYPVIFTVEAWGAYTEKRRDH